MNPEIVIGLLLLLSSFSFITTSVLLLKLTKTRAQLRRHTLTPDQELQLEDSEARAEMIIHKAMKRADKLIVKAELASLAFVAHQKIEIRKIEAEHRENIGKLLTEMSYKLETGTAEAEKTYREYLQTLEKSLTADLANKQGYLDQQVEVFFGETQKLLAGFVQSLQQQTQVQVDKEIGNARAMIDSYRQKRLEIVDENIVAILEKTLNITLAKKLTLAEQTELVYEALEEAKKGSLFV